MKRPSDHFKLLFLGLLRTATALATDAAGRGSASQAALFSAAVASATIPRVIQESHHLHPQQQQHKYKQYQYPQALSLQPPSVDGSGTTTTTSSHSLPIKLRLAKPTDVASLSECNLRTLPENYNHVFYQHHLQEWPDLALVVVVEKEKQPPHPHWHYGTTSTTTNSDPDCTVVAYLLGKIQERPNEVVHPARNIIPSGRPTRNYSMERYGHVSSLAVLPEYRRQGLAQQLLQQFHQHLIPQQCTFCGLHVRQSNRAAVLLYQRQGYIPAVTIPAYYEDGEDAYYMRKTLLSSISQQHQDDKNQNDITTTPTTSTTSSSSSQSFLESLTARWRPPERVWETGPEEYRLPRTIQIGPLHMPPTSQSCMTPTQQQQ